AQAAGMPPFLETARLWHELGDLRYASGEADAGTRAQLEAQRIYRSIGDEEGLARSLNAQALAHARAGRLAFAREQLQRALALPVGAPIVHAELHMTQAELARHTTAPSMDAETTSTASIHAAIGHAQAALAIMEPIGHTCTPELLSDLSRDHEIAGD